MKQQNQYSLIKVEKAICNQLIDAHSRYKFLVDLVFPLLNQNALWQSYPGIIRVLQANSEDSVVLALSKLIDDSNRAELITFKKFIKAAKGLPDKKVIDKSKWSEFLSDSSLFLKDLEMLNRHLDPLRNTYRVHIVPRKLNSSEITTWEYWRKILERMEGIFNLYQLAIKGVSTGQFWTIEFDHEPKEFLTWCRLDDFDKHRKQEFEKRLKHRFAAEDIRET